MAGKEKKTDTLRLPPDGLDEIMVRDFQDKVPLAVTFKYGTWQCFPAWSVPQYRSVSTGIPFGLYRNTVWSTPGYCLAYTAIPEYRLVCTGIPFGLYRSTVWSVCQNTAWPVPKYRLVCTGIPSPPPPPPIPSHPPHRPFSASISSQRRGFPTPNRTRRFCTAPASSLAELVPTRTNATPLFIFGSTFITLPVSSLRGEIQL